ncbi:MAG: arginine--tRNA ligase [Candidatus Omnitrophica bacterium]|nr:arginine--tRNA ligase [Candidatus Omnitrophota bacterium]
MKSAVRDFIEQYLKDFSQTTSIPLPEDFQFDLEQPKKKEHGDVACNFAFRLAKTVKQNPVQVAEKARDFYLAASRNDSKFKNVVRDIQVAGPGFLNFFLTESSLTQILKTIWAEKENFGRTDFGKGEKVLIEFVSANPTGPLTIAHGRQAVVGDALGRLLIKTGHQVYREYYLNDRGVQIQILGLSVYLRYLELLEDKREFPEKGYQGEYIRDLAKEVFAKEGKRFQTMPEEEALAWFSTFAANTILEDIRKDLARLDVRFDHYFSEQTLGEEKLIDRALEELKNRGFTFQSEGALWFRSTDFGDDKDRVLIKSNGEYTYLTPDIAYHEEKFKRGFHRIVNLWGPDHHGYVPRIKAACQALGHNPNFVNVLIVQLTTLFRKGEPVRMSTRAGEFVTLKELMDEVGVDATRFFFLMRKIESHLDFDLELAKQKSDENPVYYVQYAHARISNILKFAEIPVDPNANLDLIREQEELEVIKFLASFPEFLNQASEYLEPYRVIDYLRDLSALFHKFYAHHRVVNPDPELSKTRLFLVACIQRVLRNGLEVLGMSAPEKM